MSQNDWQVYNSFSGWASALATFSAVIVSLWLATRDNRVRLKVTAAFMVLAMQGDNPDERPKYVSITVTNTGYGPVRVMGLFWKVGLFRRRLFYQNPPANPYSNQIPWIFAEGEQANFLFELALFAQEAFPKFREAIGNHLSELALR